MSELYLVFPPTSLWQRTWTDLVSFTNRTFPALKLPAYSLLECGRKLDWILDNGKIAENNGAFEQSPEKSLSSRQEDGGKRYFRQRTEGAETRTMKTLVSVDSKNFGVQRTVLYSWLRLGHIDTNFWCLLQKRAQEWNLGGSNVIHFLISFWVPSGIAFFSGHENNASTL